MALAAIAVAAGCYLSFGSPPAVLLQLTNHSSAARDSLLPAGVLLALAGHLFTQARDTAESKEKRSLFYLDWCAKAYEEARQLLSDHNNYRASWIAAGRVLAHAQELSTRVTADAHKRIVDLHRLENRRFFHDLLSTKEAGFFYGIKDPSVDIDDAAKLSSAGEERAGTTYVSTLKELPEKALHAVWEAAQWPSDYHDPLETEFSPQEKGQLLVLYPGLYKYLEHKQNFDTASGCLFPRKPKGTA